MADKQIERTTELLRHIIARIEKNPEERVFELKRFGPVQAYIASGAKESVFDDSAKLEITLQALQKEGYLTYVKDAKQSTSSAPLGVSAGEEGGIVRSHATILFTVEILKSSEAIKNYLVQMEKRQGKFVSFVFDTRGEKAKLFVKDRPNAFYEMRKGDFLRYKLLYSLSTHKRRVSTRVLIRDLKSAADKIWRATEGIRDEVVSKCHVTRESIIENDIRAGTGYKIDNVKVIE